MINVEMNDKGVLVYAEGENKGKPVSIDGEEVKAVGVKSQADVDNAITRIKKERDDLQELVEQAKADGAKTGTLEKKIQELTTSIEIREREARDAAMAETESQMATLREEREEAVRHASEIENQFFQSRVQVDLNRAATSPKHTFIRPSDLYKEIGHLAHEEVDKDTGLKVLTYKLPVADDDGKVSVKHLSAEKAAEIIAANPETQHYVKGNSAGGPGGRGGNGGASKKFEDLKTDADKASYIHDNGLAAYNTLRREAMGIEGGD